MAVSPEQRNLARHALGLPNKKRKPYRNHFVTGQDSPDYPHWMAMVEAGLATRRAGSLITGWNDLFQLTYEGAAVALDRGECLDTEDFPTRDKERQT